MTPPTPKQIRVLEFLREYMLAHRGVCPSFKEIQKAVGFLSLSSVYKAVEGLQKRGHITRKPGQVRSIQFTQDACLCCGRLHGTTGILAGGGRG